MYLVTVVSVVILESVTIPGLRIEEDRKELRFRLMTIYSLDGLTDSPKCLQVNNLGSVNASKMPVE